jgi:transcriptional regulator with XRE-family HTH domain
VTPAEDEASELAQRLREAREFANLSQGFVAEQTGLSRSAISEIERGQRRVESLELKRLATLYRMPLEYFLRSTESELSAAEQSDVTLQALARASKEMTADNRRELLRFALFLQNYEGPARDEGQ